MEILRASREWAHRPNDQRFLSLTDLKAAVDKRKVESWTAAPKTKDLRVEITGDSEENKSLALSLYDPTFGENRLVTPSHFAFGQLSQYANCPAGYLRRLPAELAGINLAWGLERDSMRDEALILAQSNGENTLRAITSTTYGRIWDSQVVDAVISVNQDTRWVVPSSSYEAQNPKRSTTLYASDRDVFIFLVDPNNPIEVDGDVLYRGFMTWNSETGASTFGLTTFLYRVVCDNRIVWGATDVKELRIRHTAGGPERFKYEGAEYLQKYANETASKEVAAIKAAKNFVIPAPAKKEGVAGWLEERGFTASIAKQAVENAQLEEGQARSLWDIVNGLTATARTIPYTDDRVNLETRAGNLLKLVV